MTWGGAQGFQTPIEPESFTVDGFGVFGHAHTERNLTCKVSYPILCFAIIDSRDRCRVLLQWSYDTA